MILKVFRFDQHWDLRLLKKMDLSPLGNNIALLTNITMNMGFHYQTCFLFLNQLI